MEAIWNFQYHANEHLFIEIYGQTLGEHFWREFYNRHNEQILSLYKRLDIPNRQLLIDFINKKTHE
jgi:hypothetical protein